MSSFQFFCANAKMRHDFADQILVRYTHSDSQEYDTWVSGEEVIRRIRSEDVEESLERFSDLKWSQIRKLEAILPDLSREALEESLVNRLADELEDFMGGNLIGDNLANAVRKGLTNDQDKVSESHVWKTLLSDARFRLQVLTLAWIQLRGSFPESDIPQEPDDWV